MANQAAAAEYFQAVKRRMMDAAGVGNPFYQRNVLDPLLMSAGPGYKRYVAMNGGQMLAGGVMPSDADVMQQIRNTGGNPYVDGPQSMQAQSVAAPVVPSKPTQLGRQSGQDSRGGAGKKGSILDRLMKAFGADDKEANAANESRYQRLLGEGDYLRVARQQEADRWGQSAKAEIDQSLKEALGNAMANQAARGLSNSTNIDAFRMRATKDAALAKARVDEQVSRQKAGMLADDTNAITGYIERRTDNGPSLEAMLAAARQLGDSGYLDNEALAAEQDAAASGDAKQFGVSGTVTRMAPQVAAGESSRNLSPAFYTAEGIPKLTMPVNFNGTSRYFLPDFMNVMGSMPQPQAVGSNSYPTPGEVPNMSAGWNRALDREFAKQARIAKRLAAGYRPGDAARANANATRRRRSTRATGLISPTSSIPMEF